MTDWEWRSGRALKLTERRQQRRNIALTIVVSLALTVALAGVAAARLRDPARRATRVAVQGRRAILDTTVPTTAAATTTTEPAPTTRITLATTAPPPPTLPPIPTSATPATTAAPAATSSTAVPLTAPPTTAPRPVIAWRASPASAWLPSGGIVYVDVTAVNSGTAPGTVTAPGCPSPPLASSGGSVCAQGGQTITLSPGQSRTWRDIKLSATDDGTARGTPLPPGRYQSTIGGATVTLHVT